MIASAVSLCPKKGSNFPTLSSAITSSIGSESILSLYCSASTCGPFISLKYLCSSPALGALPLSVVDSHSHVSWGGGGGATVPLTVAGSMLSGCANLLSGAKERELGRTPDLPKVAYMYYICTYICRTTRALSHTPCGAVAGTVAVDGTVGGLSMDS